MIQEHKLFPTLILEIPDFLNKNECKKIEKSLNLKKNKSFLKAHPALPEKALSSHTNEGFYNLINLPPQKNIRNLGI